MNIISITASFKRTQSLPGYCNVATGLTVTAEVPADGDPSLIELDLHSQVEQVVNEWIDAKLEEAGQPALYSLEPRFDLLYWKQANLAFIVNAGTKLEGMPGTWMIYPSHDTSVYTGHRLPVLRALVDKLGIAGSEFGSDESLCIWAWAYLDLPVTYSIVRIQAHIGDDGEWDLLGRAIVPGDVYAALRADDSLLIELHRGTGVVGLYDDVQKTADDMSQTPTPILRTLEEVGNWIQARQVEIADEEKVPF